MTQNNKDSGSFTTGFLFGIAAGAFGYFAFGTKRGEQVRKRLQEEWQAAREHLQETAVAEQGVTQTAQSLFGQFKQFVEKTLSSFDSIDVPAEKPEKKSPKKKHARTNKFTGV